MLTTCISGDISTVRIPRVMRGMGQTIATTVMLGNRQSRYYFPDDLGLISRRKPTKVAPTILRSYPHLNRRNILDWGGSGEEFDVDDATGSIINDTKSNLEK